MDNLSSKPARQVSRNRTAPGPKPGQAAGWSNALITWINTTDSGLLCAASFFVKKALHILHLEDDARDGELIELCLRGAGLECEIRRVRDEQRFRSELESENLDLILSDFSMPGFDGIAALDLARKTRPEIPFIFLSGTIGEERAVAALKRGATDYVLKDQLRRLPSAIDRALNEAREIAMRRHAEDSARTSAERFQHLLAHSPAVLYSMLIGETAITPVFVSENVAGLLGFAAHECLEADWWRDHVHPEDREIAFAHLPQLLSRGTAEAEYRLRHRDGHYLWIQDDVRLVHDDRDETRKAVGAWTDVTERKRTQAELMQASRLAGKAEIATGILHDVRNVLTSVTISFSLLRAKVKSLSVPGVEKVANLLDTQGKLPGFLTETDQGRKVPKYLVALSDKLAQEQAALVGELDRLTTSIEHVTQLVSAQQAYAKVSGKREAVSLEAVLEESLSLNRLSRFGRDLKIVKEFAPLPPVSIEKHKLLQILVNLIRNALQACEEEAKSDKLLKVCLSSEPGWIRITVRDNGVGIAPENLTRLFEHGFTTKKHGHGFGLCSAATAAKELGGSLQVESQGPHQGASFTLKLPLPGPAAWNPN